MNLNEKGEMSSFMQTIYILLLFLIVLGTIYILFKKFA